jgi:hypothetical protein
VKRLIGGPQLTGLVPVKLVNGLEQLRAEHFSCAPLLKGRVEFFEKSVHFSLIYLAGKATQLPTLALGELGHGLNTPNV